MYTVCKTSIVAIAPPYLTMKVHYTMSESTPIQKLDSISFDAFLQRPNPFDDPNTSTCIFDLTGIELVTPCALVQLAAACHALARMRCSPTIVVDDIAVCTYLMRAGFVGVVESIARFEPDIATWGAHLYDGLRGASPMLIEVTPIESGRQLAEILNRIVAVLQDQFRYHKYDAFDVAAGVSEICQNTLDHNAQACGFLAMQVYGGSGTTTPFLEIGVADYGDGLLASLRRNLKNDGIASDDQAIDVATRLGTSEYDDATRGTGLYHLLEIAYKHRGSVQIRSGSSKVRYRMDKRRGWTFSVPPMPGVHIALTLPTKIGT